MDVFKPSIFTVTPASALAPHRANEDKPASFVAKQSGSSFNLKMHLGRGGGAAFEALTLLWSRSAGEAGAPEGWAPGRKREGWCHSRFGLVHQLVYFLSVPLTDCLT